MGDRFKTESVIGMGQNMQQIVAEKKTSEIATREYPTEREHTLYPLLLLPLMTSK